VGRVDLQRGPNSILFGTGSPAGIINVSTNGAAFNNSYNITNRVDEYGSLRDSVMLNQEIIPGVLAIRLGALQDDEKYEQQPAFATPPATTAPSASIRSCSARTATRASAATSSGASRPRTTPATCPPPTRSRPGSRSSITTAA
jgi:outer membrane receptor protein involved in Fe transport